MLSIEQVTDEERPLLYEMVQKYWDEIMPHALTVQGPAKRVAYFEEEFLRGTPESLQWWAQPTLSHKMAIRRRNEGKVHPLCPHHSPLSLCPSLLSFLK
ncbi:hypothetical protein KSF_100800 [Reticulibacter mediterranei]|uniref:Uncharacterized protein n=1 Tax=Reticulibacter mediterranei TaxID=2778369 RepID=A0A8J3J0C9_9CHLR|nr:hypothetical protein [Reticulibacter mediterranei]GHP00033.1 hypothetical protein KSF_100800 [Reticulibacter mediterranei]